MPTAAQGHRRVYRDGGAHTCFGRQPKKDGLETRRQPKKDESRTTSIGQCFGQYQPKQLSAFITALINRHYDKYQIQRRPFELRNSKATGAAWLSSKEIVARTAALEPRDEGDERFAREFRDFGTEAAKKHVWIGV